MSVLELKVPPPSWRLFCRSGYHLATPALAQAAVDASIHKGPRFSDHAPLTIHDDFRLWGPGPRR